MDSFDISACTNTESSRILDLESFNMASYFHCVICHEDYLGNPNSRSGVVMSRKCGHAFHFICITKWLATCRTRGYMGSCPKCDRGEMELSMKDLQVLYGEGSLVTGTSLKRSFPQALPRLFPTNEPMDLEGKGENVEDMMEIDFGSPPEKRDKPSSTST